MASGTHMNIPRKKIPWYPEIDKDLCTNCGTCIEFCSNGVFTLEDIETKVVAPYNCVVGCSACATECTSEAIRFPDKEELVKKLRELTRDNCGITGASQPQLPAIPFEGEGSETNAYV